MPHRIVSGVTSSGLTISGGELIQVFSGGAVQSSTVQNGGTLNLLYGAVASGSVVSSGGLISGHGLIEGAADVWGSVAGVVIGDYQVPAHLEVHSGGAANNIVFQNGEIDVDKGATIAGVVLSGIGNPDVEYVIFEDVAGRDSCALIDNLGDLQVNAGGVAVDDVIFRGGQENVVPGGISIHPVASSGGSLDDFGGQIIGGVISSQGIGFIFSGVAENLVLQAGGVLDDMGGEVVMSGASDVTWAGLLTTRFAPPFGRGSGGPIVEDGPGKLVLNGVASAFTGEMVISGGGIELARAGGLGGGTVDFAPSSGTAQLTIDGTAAPAAGRTFGNTLSNFSAALDSLDLADLTYVSGATATLSGSTLTLTNGGKTYGFILSGAEAASYGVSQDAGHGTLITPRAAAMVQAMSVFAARSAAGAVTGVEANPSLISASNLAITTSAGRVGGGIL